jgi:hypothetical protein
MTTSTGLFIDKVLLCSDRGQRRVFVAFIILSSRPWGKGIRPAARFESANLQIVQFYVVKVLCFAGKYCILGPLSAGFSCQIPFFRKHFLALQQEREILP